MYFTFSPAFFNSNVHLTIGISCIRSDHGKGSGHDIVPVSYEKCTVGLYIYRQVFFRGGSCLDLLGKPQILDGIDVVVGAGEMTFVPSGTILVRETSPEIFVLEDIR